MCEIVNAKVGNIISIEVHKVFCKFELEPVIIKPKGIFMLKDNNQDNKYVYKFLLLEKGRHVMFVLTHDGNMSTKILNVD